MALELLLRMLKVAFTEPIAVDDYMAVVERMRRLGATQQNVTTADDARVIAAFGWPASYNPFEHMERIRFACVFVSVPNPALPALLVAFDDVMPIAQLPDSRTSCSCARRGGDT